MNPDTTWAIGRWTVAPLVKLVCPLTNYHSERLPAEGGVVIAANHFSWIDPPALGAVCPRTIHFMAKVEAHRIPGVGELIRWFGAFAVRRGESDREAVRYMRAVVREGHVLGLFAEGTRQRGGVPGPVQPGAAMVAIREDVPVVPVAIHGSQRWRLGNFAPVSILWGEPMRFDGLPTGGRGYREASLALQDELHRLWRSLVEAEAVARGPRPEE